MSALRAPLLVTLLVCSAAQCIDAYDRYRYDMPNGQKVVPKTFGHRSGGESSSNLNGFGRDFNGGGWDKDLCMRDSDNDGQTNGMELGDPCCEWTSGSTPQFSNGISNPASATSVTTRNCSTVSCSNGVDPCDPASTNISKAATLQIVWLTLMSVCLSTVLFTSLV